MYKFPSESKKILRALIGRKIIGMRKIASSYIARNTDIKNAKDLFSFSGTKFYLELEHGDVIAFSSHSHQHRSIMLECISPALKGQENNRDLKDGSEVIEYSAGDPAHCEMYFSSFIGTDISSVEIIRAKESGRAALRRNERGLRITNIEGDVFIVGWNVQKEDLPDGLCIIRPEQLNNEVGVLSFERIQT